MYIRIAIFLRLQSRNKTIKVKRRQTRDFRIIKRIIVTISLLLIVGLPAIVLLIVKIHTGREHSLSYRIILFSGSMSMVGLSARMIFITRQLKRIASRIWQHNKMKLTHTKLSVPLSTRTSSNTTESVSFTQQTETKFISNSN